MELTLMRRRSYWSGNLQRNPTAGHMVNPLTKLISEGKIDTLDQLKSTYRTLVMKTHPDAVGSNKYVEGYLSLSSYYEEAKQELISRHGPNKAGKAVPRNHRLAYYQILQRLELIDKPYSFHRQQNTKLIQELKAEARFHFGIWNARFQKLYADAEAEYDRIKSETLSSFSMKNSLAITVSPIFHNIVTYHLTGIVFYRKQVNQNLKAILQRLGSENCLSLEELIVLLIRDMNNGPAVFGEGKRIYRRLHLDQDP
jgi:hypothetical protein